MKKDHKIFIISGPSGVGKTTVAKGILKKLPFLKTTVTYTTRTMRLGKKEDKTIIHVSEQEFRNKIDNGEFLEWAIVHNNFYGTDSAVVSQELQKGSLLMNIDVQGALQIKEKMPRETILIFLKTKSFIDLVKHIKKREKMPEAILALRLANAKKELSLAKRYDHVVINDEGKIKETIEKVKSLIEKELNLEG
ncbi:MAG: guanylate kinase [Patescibacteria group bacterium]|nr:guanylate kinase [Patescibacteria group bacterium]